MLVYLDKRSVSQQRYCMRAYASQHWICTCALCCAVICPRLQSCDVLVLRQPGDTLSLQNPDAAECGVLGSLQQLFHLMAGLMKTAESGG